MVGLLVFRPECHFFPVCAISQRSRWSLGGTLHSHRQSRRCSGGPRGSAVPPTFGGELIPHAAVCAGWAWPRGRTQQALALALR